MYLKSVTIPGIVLKCCNKIFHFNSLWEHRQETPFTLSRFWSLKEWMGVKDFSESVKKGKFVIKNFCRLFFDQVLKVCKK